MNNSASKPGQTLQSAFLWLTVVVLLVSFFCALWINFGIRLPTEAGDRTVGLLVDYDELKRIADSNPDISFADMARKAVVAGATGLVVRERLLADWEISGDILSFTGAELLFYQTNAAGVSSAARAVPEIVPDRTYILTGDRRIYEQLFSQLEAKRRYPEAFDYPGYLGIAVHLSSGERATLGLGFPLAQLEAAAAEGMQILPRLRNWEPVREDSLAVVFDWTAKIPNLAGIGFNDMTVPGGGADPIIQDRLAEAIRPLGKPLISFEFYDQTGLAGLAGRLNDRVLRAHAIAENELRRYANVRDAMDRFNLAATERNIRYIYLRFYGLENPAASMMSNMDLITAVRDGLAGEGLIVGYPEVLAPFSVSLPLRYLTGMGVVAAGVWLLATGAAPLLGRKRKPVLVFILLFMAGCALWAMLLLFVPALAVKLLALAGAIVFPSLGLLLAIQGEKRDADSVSSGIAAAVPPQASAGFRSGDLLRAIRAYLFLSAFTLAGAMMMSALLAAPSFMLKLDSFVGVKIAHILPLLLVPFVCWLREPERYSLLTRTVRAKVQFWQLAAFLLMLAGLAIYILRTGNESLGAVSELEMQVRQYLDRILSVRPRTKEFLVGHPAMLVLLYFGSRFSMLPVLVVGLIGQISLINTYAHIHTPLWISLTRSLHGIWIGMILGVIAVWVLLWILRLIRRIGMRYEERGEDSALP